MAMVRAFVRIPHSFSRSIGSARAQAGHAPVTDISFGFASKHGHQILTAIGERLGLLNERIIPPLPIEVGRPETLRRKARFEAVFVTHRKRALPVDPVKGECSLRLALIASVCF